MNNICVCRFLPPFVFASCLGSFEILKFVWKYKLLPLVVTNLSLEPRLYFGSRPFLLSTISYTLIFVGALVTCEKEAAFELVLSGGLLNRHLSCVRVVPAPK